jgi:4-diphosphocytidyl-2-C-methyl-D-erythritol kinase
MPLSLPAPAKLNLLLRILGRRPDGYHRLQAVFQFLDYGDQIHLRARPDGALRSLRPLAGVAPGQELTLRAAALLQRESGTHQGVEIDLHKRLPMGGGVGGGSSDAATVLVGLNRLWGLGLPVDTLAELGLRLGADVPVFVRGRAAWGEGIGERLQPLELPEPWYLVALPPVQVATAAVFSDPELTRDSSPITISDFLAGDTRNDCLPLVARRYSAVAQALEWLGRFGKARLTGTGAAVFAAFPEEAAARQALASLPAGLPGFVARGRNRSPLLDALPE